MTLCQIYLIYFMYLYKIKQLNIEISFIVVKKKYGRHFWHTNQKYIVIYTNKVRI